MAGGTINGGTLAFADGKTLNVTNSAAGTLSGVTVNGDLSFLPVFNREGGDRGRHDVHHRAPSGQFTARSASLRRRRSPARSSSRGAWRPALCDMSSAGSLHGRHHAA